MDKIKVPLLTGFTIAILLYIILSTGMLSFYQPATSQIIHPALPKEAQINAPFYTQDENLFI